ncbi:TPA: filamentous hemagglutinin N-terminal domain-containing protein [Escherichia coli]|uniref:two-partner secretion domain-containing protein n=1 Tax=Escherichia coli TaxID=562 RepID=UPI000E2E416D|nr:filamentous hemagglutinin N-terminal domain-containing protein [Escherichia coli]EFB1110344.1 filamentous hemagglutinin N-terminal domain-containing protein [Escherichia coli]EFD0793508.1 filamentous hemagglutinin N-terminal domain-containing protein [Escherichia coli]EFJ3337833.1 filamentous hemagglutinin N-terminal domain-containing protein [Escherichia coli]EGI1234419.1 filamentous hemagglutinin N-terminal domain-containing protein [Escherichia coli]EIH4002029.1 filamentous hemagglutinin
MAMINLSKEATVGKALTPIAILMMLSFPVASQAAGLVIKNGTVYNANGVPVVDINKPNGSGLSHNIWDNLNVDKNGVVFNNSANESSTSLAGNIQGNSNLTSGSAKVILNEVTSKNPSTINGMMEVAGDKADLIIANPNGITVNGGGSINTGKLTLTTGTPDIQDDKLAGYSVNGGTITLGKLDNASPTEILSRNVVVNGKVSADELNVVAGNNYVNAAGQVTGSVSATGSRNGYSVDVTKLGGMYANKISLVSTEKGVGVRNLGVIAGGVNGVSIDSKGNLLNSNAQIQSASTINLTTNGTLDNTTGTVTSVGTISLNTNKNTIVNTRAGNISTMGDIYVNSGTIDNTNGKLAAAGMLAVDTNNATLINSGKGSSVGIEAGIVALKTGTLNNSNGQIRGGYVGLESGALNNNNGDIQTTGDIAIISNGNVDNNKGLIRSSTGHIVIGAAGSVNNGSTKTADTGSSDSLGIIADTGVEIGANNINNNGGQIASNGNVSLSSYSTVDDYAGKILSNSKVIIKGSSLRNDTGGISGKQGIEVAVGGSLTNNIGVISSEEGDISLLANSVDNHGGFMMGQNITMESMSGVNNNTALIVASKKLKINAFGNIENRDGNSFGNAYGLYFGMPQQTGGMVGKEGIVLSGQNIYNNNSRLIAEDGPLTLQAQNTFDNTRALVTSGADASIQVGGTYYNNYATTWSAGNLDIDATTLQNSSSGTMIDNNATGFIASDKNLSLEVVNSLTNYGWISGKGDVDVTVNNGNLYNRNTIAAEKGLDIAALNGIENWKDISAGGDLTMNTNRHVTNNSNSNMVGQNIVINAVNDINNRGNIVSDADLNVTTKGNLYNYLYMVGYGDVALTANSVANNNATIEATGDLIIDSKGNVGNNRGNLHALNGVLSVKGSNLNNDYGEIRGYDDVTLALTGNYDSFKGSLTSETGDVTLTANIIDNAYGLIAGENVSVDAKSTIYNNTALIAANKKLVINAGGNLENRDGNNFLRNNGALFGITDNVGGIVGKEGVTLSAQNVYNNNSSIIAENGPLNLLSRGTLDNTRALLSSGADAIIRAAGMFYNNYATTYSAGNLDVYAASLNNASDGRPEDNTATGVIASDKNLDLNVDNSVTNYGWISGKGDVHFNVLKGTLYNRNAIAADNALTINALNGVENFKDIVAGTALTIDTQKYVTNNSNSNMLGQTIAINAVNDINNRGNIVGDYSLGVKTTGNIYNYLNMLSYGVAGVSANKVTNSGKDAVLGGFYGLALEANETDNTGTIVGM